MDIYVCLRILRKNMDFTAQRKRIKIEICALLIKAIILILVWNLVMNKYFIAIITHTIPSCQTCVYVMK